MTAHGRARLGRSGEIAALVWLLLKGYRLRHRRWRGSGGELDLVMERAGVLVFVEVKTRSDAGFGGATAAVDRGKRERIVRAASAYLSQFGLWESPSRFDVVTLEKVEGLWPWRIRHWVGAFQADCGRLL